MMKIIITLFVSICFTGIVHSENYYCNPATGAVINDGSIDNPWSTLSDVFNAGKSFNSGDTIFAYGGEHGIVTLSKSNTNYVVISALNGQQPKLSGLIINDGSYWKLIGVDIARTAPATNYNVYNVSDDYFLVQTSKRSSYISLEECNVYTEGVDVEQWGRMDWYTGVLSGIILRGKYNYIHKCTIKNTNFSIEVRGRYTEMTNSTIENFVGDAIRALSSYSKYEYNTVKNSYDITGYDDNSTGQNPDYPVGKGNHDDLLQSYTSRVGGAEYVVSDVSVRYNKFFSYTEENQVDKSYTQGVACFDGFFNNWVVENNLIVTDSWHGITMLGVNDILIANNTIVANPIDNDLKLGNGAAVNDMTPFIWIGKTKSGEESYDNIVRNNLIIESKFGASGFKNIIDDGENTLVQNNHTIPTASDGKYFVDFEKFNFHTKDNSPAINQGINIDLLQYDLDKFKRLIGPKVDCGAYEFDNSLLGNNCPIIAPIENQQVEEHRILDLFLKASTTDSSAITMSVFDLDSSFMSFEDMGLGEGLLTIKPQTGDVGKYSLSLIATDNNGNENIQTFIVEVLYGTTAVNDYKKESFEIYPNPVMKGCELTISGLSGAMFGEINVDVYDMKSTKIYNVKQEVTNSSFKLNTNFIRERGVYILAIEGNNKMFLVQ